MIISGFLQKVNKNTVFKKSLPRFHGAVNEEKYY